jgi:hypothetical protein
MSSYISPLWGQPTSLTPCSCWMVPGAVPGGAPRFPIVCASIPGPWRAAHGLAHGALGVRGMLSAGDDLGAPVVSYDVAQPPMSLRMMEIHHNAPRLELPPPAPCLWGWD